MYNREGKFQDSYVKIWDRCKKYADFKTQLFDEQKFVKSDKLSIFSLPTDSEHLK